MSRAKNCPKVLVIGPTPPPHFGPAKATEIILNSKLNESFTLLHLDTADRRALSNIGQIDVRNVYLALKHLFQLFLLLVFRRPAMVYIPISQATPAYLRDATFIFLSKLFCCKVVLHLRGSYFRTFYEESNFIMKLIIKTSLQVSDCLIVLCESVKKIFDGLFPEARLRVVSNGLLVASDRERRCSYNNNGNTRRILYLSTLMEAKGFLDVLDAVPHVVGEFSEVEFCFVGEWFSELDRRAAEDILQRLCSEVRCHVHIYPPVSGEEKSKLFTSADVFVFPPNEPEGQPWVILEAMSVGLPIITRDQGCIKEMVIDGENGFIVEKKNPQVLADKVLLLLRNDELRRRMGKASRKRLLTHFTEERFINGLAQVFHEVVNSQVQV